MAGPISELSSGVDALYLSGWAPIPQDVRERLARGRELAEAAGEPVPFRFGGQDFAITGRGLRKYPFCLKHEHGLILLNPRVARCHQSQCSHAPRSCTAWDHCAPPSGSRTPSLTTSAQSTSR
jgi:hypothetical protein